MGYSKWARESAFMSRRSTENTTGLSSPPSVPEPYLVYLGNRVSNFSDLRIHDWFSQIASQSAWSEIVEVIQGNIHVKLNIFLECCPRELWLVRVFMHTPKQVYGAASRILLWPGI